MRNLVLCCLVVFPLFAHAGGSGWDKSRVEYQGDKDITVYRSPDCGCCSGWIEHLQRHGFTVKDVKSNDLNNVKLQHRIPVRMASCHTAVIDGYRIEGHVPADDIKRLLKQRPDVAGLAVPQMPVGTPGMEMGERKDPFVVYQFGEDGNAEIFTRYERY